MYRKIDSSFADLAFQTYQRHNALTVYQRPSNFGKIWGLGSNCSTKAGLTLELPTMNIQAKEMGLNADPHVYIAHRKQNHVNALPRNLFSPNCRAFDEPGNAMS